MEETMTRATRRPIGFGGAFLRQLVLLWMSRRPLLLGIALLALLVFSGEPWVSDTKTRLLTLWLIWPTIIGPIWAFAVFHNEGPSNRLYHWSLPVSRWQHTLARLAAGLAWLWIAYAVLIGVGALMGAMDGDLWQLGEVTIAGWVNFFTGPLLGYLVISILTVASDYPLRWFFGLLFLFLLTLSTLDGWLGLEELVETILEPLTNTDWGLLPVMFGGLWNAVIRLDHTLRAMADPSYAPGGVMEVGHWWLATVLWILLFAGIVALIASRHPDTLPRLRRSG